MSAGIVMTERNLGKPPIWYRDKTGTTVHHATCTRRANTAVPWWFAQDMAETAVFAFIDRYSWLHRCKVCLPSAGSDTAS